MGGVPRTASQPDQDVSAALAVRDLDVSARTVERLRLAGLLATRVQQRPCGTRGGSISRLAPGEVDRAAYAHALRVKHGSYSRATLAMFVDGRYSVPKDRLESAYDESLASARCLIDRHAGGASDDRSAAVEVAGWIAGQICKRRDYRTLRKRLRRDPPLGMTVRRSLENAATDMMLLLVRGRADFPDGLREMLVVTGVADVLNDPASGQPTEPLDTQLLEELSPHLSLTALAAGVRSARLHELERARDFAKALRTFAKVYGIDLKRTHGLRAGFIWLLAGATSDMAIAYATPMLAVVMRAHPELTQQWFELMARWTPIFAQNPSNTGANLG